MIAQDCLILGECIAIKLISNLVLPVLFYLGAEQVFSTFTSVGMLSVPKNHVSIESI